MKLNNNKYSMASKFIPGRTDVQCNDRYKNILSEQIRKVRWNDDVTKIFY